MLSLSLNVEPEPCFRACVLNFETELWRWAWVLMLNLKAWVLNFELKLGSERRQLTRWRVLESPIDNQADEQKHALKSPFSGHWFSTLGFAQIVVASPTESKNPNQRYKPLIGAILSADAANELGRNKRRTKPSKRRKRGKHTDKNTAEQSWCSQPERRQASKQAAWMHKKPE